jgi:ATP-binding cassette subfamily B protein
MLVRFHDPWSSRVTIDGHDLRHVTQASLRARMGVVLQDGFVFRSTIRENIRMGRPTATEEAIADAARDAGMTQRLALARAILRKPAIVLLDEISSALDPAEDLAVNRTLDELSKTTTLISATHRLASVTGASHIFVFDKGRLVEQGSHFELMGMHGTYASLWHKQAGFRLSPDGRHVDADAQRLQVIPILEQFRNRYWPNWRRSSPPRLSKLGARSH